MKDDGSEGIPEIHESQHHIGETALILYRLDNLTETLKDVRDELKEDIGRVETQAIKTNGRVTMLEKAKLIHDGFLLAYGKFTPFVLAGFGGVVVYAIPKLLGE